MKINKKLIGLLMKETFFNLVVSYNFDAGENFENETTEYRKYKNSSFIYKNYSNA